MRTHEEFAQTTPLGDIAIAVTRYPIESPRAFNVPYEGTRAEVNAAFPQGFPPSYGSGIAFKELREDGTLVLYCLTDRGPNGDGPRVPHGSEQAMDSKLFPAPGFTPSIGVLHVNDERAMLVESMPIRHADGQLASGLPIPQGAVGNSAEVPLFDALHFDPAGKARFHAGGIDSEAIAFDACGNVLWVTDEYGPFLLKIDPANGHVRQRYGPGSGLPAVLALRRPNRGMEGMTFDPASGLVHAFLQSPLSDGAAWYATTGREEKIERYAAFLRWIVFDPAQGSTRASFAYPLAAAAFAHGRTGHAKLGDVAALGDGKFVVIEQGEGADGRMFNALMLIDTAGATDIGNYGSDLERSSMAGAAVGDANWGNVVPLRKRLLVNLNAIGWVAEKAEGLALIDACTLALTNDSDFGMKTRLYDALGQERMQVDVTDIDVDATGAIVAGANRGDDLRVAPGAGKEGALTLWLLRFKQPLAQLAL